MQLLRHAAMLGLISGCIAILAEDTPQVPVTDQTPTPEAVVQAAKVQIAKLSGDNFDDRDAAQRALEKLDLSVLPWLRKLLQDDQSKHELNAESRDALTRVVAELDKRNVTAALAYGSPVSIHLDSATQAEVLAEIGKQTGNQPLQGLDTVSSEKTKQPFTYSGPYWGAMDELARVFPLKAPEEGQHEDPFAEDVFRRGHKPTSNFASAYRVAHGHAGVCCLRVVKSSLNCEASGTYLTIDIVPHIENRFFLEKADVKPGAIVLGDGKKLESVNLLSHENMWHQAPTAWTFCVSLANNANPGSAATLNGTIDLQLYELKLFRQDLSKSAPYTLPDGSTLTVVESSEKEFKFKVSGPGQESHAYSRNVDEFLKLFDAENKPITYQHHSTSSGGEMNGWHSEWGMSLNVKPAFIELSVPMPAPKVSVPFIIKDIPLPHFQPAGGKQ